jgi:pyruvate/2-oxoglutarate dehydrogenase complex dihydrolipoamide acyltransferase (E2) component
MSDFQYVNVPRESANDDAVVLVEWLRADGAEVASGDAICSLETSKATVEQKAPRPGWLFHLCKPGDQVRVGDPVAVISGKPERPAESLNRAAVAHRGVGEPEVTRKAQALLDQHGLDLSAFKGLELVRERDVVRVLRERQGAAAKPDTESELVGVSPFQARAARVLEESYRTIPHSYVSVWVDAEECARRLAAMAGKLGIMATVSDLVVCAVAKSAAVSPKLNAAWSKEGLLLHKLVNVGFALNLPNGDLVVPVVHKANELSFEQLVSRIRGLHKKAVQRKLAPEDVAGGTITTTSLIGSGVHQVIPLIVPGQSAIVAVADAAPVAGGSRQCITLGFDHRVINGAEAAAFLGKVARVLTEGEHG